jgi:hypothetical protein
MKRLLVVVVAVGAFAICVALPVAGQAALDSVAPNDVLMLHVKAQVTKAAKRKPRDHVLIRFRDGSQITGRILQAHDKDFVLEESNNKQQQTVAYTELVAAPKRVQPTFKQTATKVGQNAAYLVLLPLITIAGAFGAID